MNTAETVNRLLRCRMQDLPMAIKLSTTEELKAGLELCQCHNLHERVRVLNTALTRRLMDQPTS